MCLIASQDILFATIRPSPLPKLEGSEMGRHSSGLDRSRSIFASNTILATLKAEGKYSRFKHT